MVPVEWLECIEATLAPGTVMVWINDRDPQSRTITEGRLDDHPCKHKLLRNDWVVDGDTLGQPCAHWRDQLKMVIFYGNPWFIEVHLSSSVQRGGPWSDCLASAKIGSNKARDENEKIPQETSPSEDLNWHYCVIKLSHPANRPSL